MEFFNLKVFRYDPTKDSQPYYKTYKLPVEKGMTLLAALFKAKEEQDPTISFRYNCRAAICGSCAVRVNGHAALACKVQITHLLEKYQTDTIVVEPVGNIKPLKDLIYDMDWVIDKMKRIKPWFIPKEPPPPDGKEYRQSEYEHNKIDFASDCILCNSCMSDCNALKANKDFLGPMVISKAYRFIADSRDGAKKERLEEVLKDYNLEWCVRCMECTTRCPKEVQPYENIIRTRIIAAEEGYKTPGEIHATIFEQDIVNRGLLNEMLLPMRQEGILGALKRAPFGIRMFFKGKVNIADFFGGHKIKRLDEVKTIYEVAQRKKKDVKIKIPQIFGLVYESKRKAKQQGGNQS
ncbi:succinate dehydrogenase/fumarate reductase iron-sulfur subunit [Venenivibrio stagnispumantis]|uniref:Fumarate reductase iron-sulfur subunit n=1 Tax=Venenivibrio stagnispumantis TaxID=407998 RepID=A0AA45WKS5_9AQUI|nr:succinate dehydrogenase/fumarate reductase iron-sulfur subunit [Venenivibrio stagnispumantis]MCW4573154.1 succinate dehydrogenase/fumarate reductase iron-sulfur subunit [Venenivibrio stagnispumantis]SMP08374.1 succinate dehydrogenase / fumarate reductase iron-sulfur subunit [Venenivibrio stagnispumantis]